LRLFNSYNDYLKQKDIFNIDICDSNVVFKYNNKTVIGVPTIYNDRKKIKISPSAYWGFTIGDELYIYVKVHDKYRDYQLCRYLGKEENGLHFYTASKDRFTYLEGRRELWNEILFSDSINDTCYSLCRGKIKEYVKRYPDFYKNYSGKKTGILTGLVLRIVEDIKKGKNFNFL
jgi:hypothetical protein